MKTIRFILISCLMLLAVTRVHAYGNDYLEHQDHLYLFPLRPL